MIIDRLDHLVLTVADIERTCMFYERALGFETLSFGQGRKALRFGSQKINLHQADKEFLPHAYRPTPGSADLCFITRTPLSVVQEELHALGVAIEDGPVQRTGATGPLVSIYLRDPDQNLIEISNYVP